MAKRLPSEEYWIKRAALTLVHSEKNELEFERDMELAYKRARQHVKKEIEAFYERYGKEQGLSTAEVKKSLNTKELKSFKEQHKYYLDEVEKYGADPAYRSYLKKLSARAYVSRLEELITNIRHEVEMLAAKQHTGMEKIMKEGYEDGFYRSVFDLQKQVGVGVSFSKPGKETVEKAVRTKWFGRNFSSSVWNNKKALVFQINQLLPQAFAAGRTSHDVAEQLDQKLQSGYKAARRLARTEINFISNQATLDGYKASGVVTHYKYLATLDNRTSEQCQGMDGKVVPVTEAQVGVNLPPLHAHCRSTTIPYFEDDDIGKLIDDRVATNAEDKTYFVGNDVTYEDWVKNYAESSYAKRVTKTPEKYEDMDYDVPEIDWDNVLSLLKENPHDENAYRTPFSLPENVEDANEIARYMWRIGPYADLGEPPSELFQTTRIDLADLRSTQEDVRKSTMRAFVEQRLDPDAILDNGQLPFVIKSGNTYLIEDGHHRAAYAKILGVKSLKVTLLDLDDVKKKLNGIEVKPYNNKVEPPKRKTLDYSLATLKNYAGHAEKWEQDIVKKARQLTDEDIELIGKTMRQLIENNEFCMRVPSKRVLAKILEEGKFKNQFETGTSGGLLNKSVRKGATHQLFGSDSESMHNTDFEKYGYLGQKDFAQELKDHRYEVGQYGDVRIVFDKQKLMDRTTFTTEDSLGPAMRQAMVAGDVNNPRANGIDHRNLFGLTDKLKKIDDKGYYRDVDIMHDPINFSDAITYGSYIELQYHGQLTTKDIKVIQLTDYAMTHYAENREDFWDEFHNYVDEHAVEIVGKDSKSITGGEKSQIMSHFRPAFVEKITKEFEKTYGVKLEVYKDN